MATPTALPSTFTANTVLPAASLNLLRGAFRVLQVVQSSYGTAGTSVSGTYADTGLTVTITPQYNTSKILVICSLTLFNNAASTSGGLKLLRGATTLITNVGYGFSSGGSQSADPTIITLDSPASTSALTYKLQFNRDAGAGTVIVFPNNNTATITVMEISA